jgi:hypothetical protein
MAVDDIDGQKRRLEPALILRSSSISSVFLAPRKSAPLLLALPAMKIDVEG